MSDPLASCLERLFHRCIIRSYFPDALKIAKVVPLHKEGDKHKPTNYRPISLLPTIGKIFEKLIYNRLVQFLDRYHILSEKQFGFRNKRSTVDAIATLVETIRQLWTNRTNVSCCTFLDLRKAFDTVDHKLLLQKCFCYGFRKETYKLIESFLKNREQYIQIGTKKSSLKLVETGVPQGSILGPILFLIYINDIKSMQKETDLILYADDTAIITGSRNIELLNNHQLALNDTNDWIKENKLVLNANKTKNVLLNGRRKIQFEKEFSFGNETIESVKQYKYLGVIIDCQLSFQHHVSYIEKRLVKFCGIFYRLKKVLTSRQMIQVFRTYIKPILQYGVLIYGSTSKNVLKNLEKLTKRLIKIIFYKRSFESLGSLREEHKLFTVRELHIYELFKTLINILRGECKIASLSNLLSGQDLENLSGSRSKRISTSKNSCVKNCLYTRLRRLLNLVLIIEPMFVDKVKNLKKKRNT